MECKILDVLHQHLTSQRAPATAAATVTATAPQTEIQAAAESVDAAPPPLTQEALTAALALVTGGTVAAAAGLEVSPTPVLVGSPARRGRGAAPQVAAPETQPNEDAAAATAANTVTKGRKGWKKTLGFVLDATSFPFSRAMLFVVF